MPASFGSLSVTALAAKARMLRFENDAYGGLRAEAKLEELQEAQSGLTFLNRQREWAKWFSSSIPHLLL